MPSPKARFPVVTYFYDSGGSLASCGQALRQMAGLGCAAVAIEYDVGSQARFENQIAALDAYLKKQRWAQSYGAAWVGCGSGAQRSLSFLVTHPEAWPRVYVRVGGGMVEAGESEVERRLIAERGRRSAKQRRESDTAVLLVHGERDEMYPASECQRVGALLATNGVQVETRILAGLPHGFGEEAGVVMRMVAEYCVARLPTADYAAGVEGCTLSGAERERFNLAMARAGRHRGELWKAVTSSREPERRTVMIVIGGLEDYDLAHIGAQHLRETVQVAWQARRTYRWCRDTPVDIFERFTAAPRAFEEPLERTQSALRRRLSREVKYCRSIGEVCDTVGKWERRRTAWKPASIDEDPTPREVLAYGGGDCQHLISLFIYSARAVGVAARPVVTTWPTLGNRHYWAEIWDPEERAWHSFDGSSAERPYHFAWVMNVPKAATHAATGERGAWNAASENRWEAYTNTVRTTYPSGIVLVRVLDRGGPRANQRVNVEAWLAKGQTAHLTSGQTDRAGEVRFTLGQSARHPYRFVLDGVQAGAWEWLAVEGGKQYSLTLDADQGRPFNAAVMPPPLGFPEWKKRNDGRGQ
jgi:predicted esterase